jgi:hypothetical protein
LIFSFLYFLPAQAQVSISEVAWMGTSESSSDEWLELQNDSDSAVSLTGWTLEWGTEGSSPKYIDLGGVVPGGAHYLLERTDDETLPGVPADLLYVGALSNSGEKLILRSAGVIIQTLDFLGGWPAGDNISKDTMQWNGSAWVSAPATPRARNTGVAVTPVTPDPTTGFSSPTTTPGSTSATVPVEAKSFSVSVGKDRSISVNSLAKFSVVVNPASYASRLTALWSFGDGSRAEGLTVGHYYSIPGKYSVNVRVSSETEYVEARLVVSVIDQTVRISEVEEGYEGYVTLENDSPIEVKLGHYGLSSGPQLFSFPESFTILPNAQVRIPARISGLVHLYKRELDLRSPDGSVLLVWHEPIPLPIIAPLPLPEPPEIGPVPTAARGVISVAPIPAKAALVANTEPPKLPVQIKTNETKIIEIPRKKSLLNRVISLPRRLIGNVINAL